MEKINIRDAVPGMILARTVTVLSAAGRELIQKGATLEKSHIAKLKQWGIELLFIETLDENAPPPPPFSESIRLLARQTYEDAITALTRISFSLLEQETCNLDAVTHSVSQIMEVVSLEGSILSLLSRIRTSDEYLYRHSVDVCVISLVIARKLGLKKDDLKALGIASLLHDVGMMRYKKDGWDNCMLTAKPGKIKEHPIHSHKLASGIRDISPVTLDAILKHHELYDGSGYPEGIAGDDIPMVAGVLSIAEAFCTLTGPHNEKNAIEPYRAVSHILETFPERFHQHVRRAFIGSVALYPPGTFVLLSNEARGVVIASNKDCPLRPRVLVLYSANNVPVEPYHLDLTDNKHRTVFVEKPISPLTDLSPIAEALKT